MSLESERGPSRSKLVAEAAVPLALIRPSRLASSRCKTVHIMPITQNLLTRHMKRKTSMDVNEWDIYKVMTFRSER